MSVEQLPLEPSLPGICVARPWGGILSSSADCSRAEVHAPGTHALHAEGLQIRDPRATLCVWALGGDSQRPPSGPRSAGTASTFQVKWDHKVVTPRPGPSLPEPCLTRLFISLQNTLQCLTVERFFHRYEDSLLLWENWRFCPQWANTETQTPSWTEHTAWVTWSPKTGIPHRLHGRVVDTMVGRRLCCSCPQDPPLISHVRAGCWGSGGEGNAPWKAALRELGPWAPPAAVPRRRS